MKKLFFLPIIFSFAFFMSCEEEECKTCEINIAFVDADAQAFFNAFAVLEGYADFKDYVNAVMPTEEEVTVGFLCGDDISGAESDWEQFTGGDDTSDIDGDGFIDATFSFTCD
mgnify:CR=1 FL=1|tara:strand:+ start:89 stop:427 length:339 start_codon:yes stop_codon:yes gene_type:complete